MIEACNNNRAHQQPYKKKLWGICRIQYLRESLMKVKRFHSTMERDIRETLKGLAVDKENEMSREIELKSKIELPWILCTIPWSWSRRIACAIWENPYLLLTNDLYFQSSPSFMSVIRKEIAGLFIINGLLFSSYHEVMPLMIFRYFLSPYNH